MGPGLSKGARVRSYPDVIKDVAALRPFLGHHPVRKLSNPRLKSAAL